ncbi:MAG: DUF2071 domain-containing protein, partial [Gaiellaceae bacterium]
MLFSVNVRDLVLASWETDAERVARTLPPGLEPAEVDGRHLVTLAALRYQGGRLGRLPVPPFSQLNVRAYVEWEGEPAVVFLMTRVTAPGMGGALLGAPYRPARLRVRPGSVQAPGLGVSVPYERKGPRGSGPGALGRHELGIFEAAGLRAVRIRRGQAEWEDAAPAGPVRADPLLALGFDVSGRPS